MMNRVRMANISAEQKNFNTAKIYFAVKSTITGITEAEIAEIAGVPNRTTHRYLDILAGRDLIYKIGHYWLCDSATPAEFNQRFIVQ